MYQKNLVNNIFRRNMLPPSEIGWGTRESIRVNYMYKKHRRGCNNLSSYWCPVKALQYRILSALALPVSSSLPSCNQKYEAPREILWSGLWENLVHFTGLIPTSTSFVWTIQLWWIIHVELSCRKVRMQLMSLSYLYGQGKPSHHQTQTTFHFLAA